jgi:hypothetical protein
MRESAQKMTLSSLPCSWSKISFLSRAEHRLRSANCSGRFHQCRNRCEPAAHKPRPSQVRKSSANSAASVPMAPAAAQRSAAQPRVRPQARHPPSCLFRAATAVRCDAHTVRACAAARYTPERRSAQHQLSEPVAQPAVALSPLLDDLLSRSAAKRQRPSHIRPAVICPMLRAASA